MSSPISTWPKLIGVTVPYRPAELRRSLLLVDELWVPTAPDYADNETHYLALLDDVSRVLREQSDVGFLESAGVAKPIPVSEADFWSVSSSDSRALVSWTIVIMCSVIQRAANESGMTLSSLLNSLAQSVSSRLNHPLVTGIINENLFHSSLAWALADCSTRAICASRTQNLGVEAVSIMPLATQTTLEQATDLFLTQWPTMTPALSGLTAKEFPFLQQFHDILVELFPGESRERLRTTFNQILTRPPIPQSSVLQITLKTLPIPDSAIPLKDLIQYSHDEETRTKLARLRFWMRKTARTERSSREIAEEIQESMFAYEEHMKRSKLKYEQGSWRAILTTTAEVLDSAVHLKFKPIVDALFSIEDKRLQLLDAEASAPGKEVAYITAIQKDFASGKNPTGGE